MAKPTPVQLNAAKQQFEGSEPQGEQGEGTPADIRNEKPRIMKLAKAMSMKPLGKTRA